MTSTSHTLLLRLRRREDQGAWERFVALYTPLLLRWTQRSGFAEQDAVDLVQDVFATLIVELPRFELDPLRGRFRAWLKTVTLNKCRDRQRRRLVVPSDQAEYVLAELTTDDVFESLWDAEYQDGLLRRAMEIMRSQFEPKTWQAAWELTANQLTAAETSQKLGMSEAAVYVAKSRVLRRLRHELAGLLD